MGEITSEKKKNPFLRILKFIIYLFSTILLIIILGCVFSALHKKNVLETLPRGFSVYVHTDSLWDAADPMLDLKAADLFLSGREMTGIRGAFMSFRASSLRQNGLISFLASRKADLALYPKEDSFDFVASVDLSWLSLVTRAGQYFIRSAKIADGLEFNESTSFFEYNTGSSRLYISPCRNLVLVSSSEELLRLSLTVKNNSYTQEELDFLEQKTEKSIRLVADTASVTQQICKGNSAFEKTAAKLSDTEFTEISFNIKDESISIEASLPLKKTDESQETTSDFYRLFSRNSRPSSLTESFSSNVQYYTLVNAGNLKELKDAAFECLPDSKEALSLWNRSSSLSKMLFSISLDEMIFSWTGDEFAVLGIESQNDPVFVFEIRDEMQRENIFDRFLSSIIIKSSSSLILDGMRLPQIMLPDFLQNVLSLFDVKIPSPYYFVSGNYIYFSENPENLSSIYSMLREKKFLSQTERFKEISDSHREETSLSVYYNLERTQPFFIRSNAGFSNVMKLYSLGRLDVSVNNGSVLIALDAVSNAPFDMKKVPGFPIETGKSDGNLIQKENHIYWTENSSSIKSMEIPSTKISEYNFEKTSNKLYILPAEKINESSLWCVTEKGEVYLFTKNLEPANGFPVTLSHGLEVPPSVSEDKLIVCTSKGKVSVISASGKVSEYQLPVTGSIKSAPFCKGKYAAFYDKSFIGRILIIDTESDFYLKYSLNVQELGFGSPAIKLDGEDLYTVFIGQNGKLSLWKNEERLELPVEKLEGIYYTNFTPVNDGWITLSSTGTVSLLKNDGSIQQVKLPSIPKAEKDIFITVKDNIYLCADSNLIYALTPELEIACGYPVIGWGNPCSADLNGDGEKECIALSLDHKLYAWNLK